MHTEVKTLSVKENQSSFISYLLKDGRDGNIMDIAVNEFWTRVAMHSLKGRKKVKVVCQGNRGTTMKKSQVATTQENVMRVGQDFERPNIRTTGFNLGDPVTT